MTSVSGHLLNFEFDQSVKGWQSCNPVQLFEAPVHKACPKDSEKIKVIYFSLFFVLNDIYYNKFITINHCTYIDFINAGGLNMFLFISIKSKIWCKS